MNRLTGLIERVAAGEQAARDELFAAAYADLHRLAHARLRGGARDTVLQTTSLVHESYLRFVKLQQLRLEDRSHFLAYAARVMRSVVVDLVRERHAERRGGDLQLVTYDTAAANALPASSDEVLSSPPSTPGWCAWSKCATSSALRWTKSRRRWAWASAPSSATGRRRAAFSTPASSAVDDPVADGASPLRIHR
jgi:DNA-directed RNA polymerase specialized sigma24 family protein